MPKPKKIIPLDKMFIGDLGPAPREETTIGDFFCDNSEDETCGTQCTYCKFQEQKNKR